ncbi:MAG: SDR family oxidoreductase [Kineosporiaceae bacterium]
MRIVVVGGTGTVGRPTVEELARRGHDVRVLSRHSRPGAGRCSQVAGDVTTGAGLAEAMDGVDAVVDVSNVATLDEGVATRFFVRGTERLVAAEAAAGVRHHVLLSIVGVDRVPTGYYRAKVAQERAVAVGAEAAGVRWSVLRATQFLEFAGQMIERLRRGPLLPVPVMAVQPVSTLDVARALADVVERGANASGRVPDLAGPDPMSLTDMVRDVLHARGERGLVLPMPLPGAAGRAMRSGALRPASGAPVRFGTVTFEDYLAHLRTSRSVPLTA